MSTIVAISGSLRARSYNTMLLHAAVAAAPGGAIFEVGSIKDIPLYDGDLEATAGIPAPVRALKDQLTSADGILFVSPEYNNGIPGVFKNAIDWLSRPSADIPRLFGARPVGVIGATPGRGGTNLAQAAWLPVLRALGAIFYAGGRLGVASASSSFDAHGTLTDATIRGLLEKYLTGFVAFVDRHARRA